MTKPEPKHHSPKVKRANASGSLKAASQNFRDMLNDGGLKPSTFLLGRMRDDPGYRDPGDPDCAHRMKGGLCIDCGKEERVSMPLRTAIGDKLVQYELPRLAAIEAEVTTDGKSHEDWVRELGGEMAHDDEDEGRTLQ